MSVAALTLALEDHIGSPDSLNALATEIVSAWLQIWNAESCDILIRNGGESLVLAASTHFPERVGRIRLGKGVGLCGHVMQTSEPVFISKDVQADPRYARYPDTPEHSFAAEVVLPLGNAPSLQGVLLLRFSDPTQFEAHTRHEMIAMAQVSSVVLRTWQAAFSLGGRQNRLGALSEVSKTIAKSPYLEEILQLLVNYTAQQFDYRVCTLRLLDESSQELVLRATQAPAKAYQKKRAIKLGESYAGKAIVANKPIVVQDVQVAEDYVGHDLAIEQGLRSMICVPLTLLDRPIGVLTCYTAEIREFSVDEIKALETLAKQAAVSIEHAKMQVRNTLMQEMHHRVKNNLQQVASLLRLQMRHSTYKTIEEALNDCLNRILAISSVHDLLSRDDLDHVSIRSIAESLVHHQQSSFLLPDRTVRFEVRGSDIHLSMTQATQLALVLNELIQNAIEHGFRKATDGEIHVNIEHVEELDEVSVWVSNSGDPLPDGFDPTVTSNLGLKIVDNLARGLNGRFKMANVLGWTVAEVKFHRATSE